MSQTRIAVIVGSLRKDSFNRKLALAHRASRARRTSLSSTCASTTCRSTTRTTTATRRPRSSG